MSSVKDLGMDVGIIMELLGMYDAWENLRKEHWEDRRFSGADREDGTDTKGNWISGFCFTTSLVFCSILYVQYISSLL